MRTGATPQKVNVLIVYKVNVASLSLGGINDEIWRYRVARATGGYPYLYAIPPSIYLTGVIDTAKSSV